MEDGYRLMWRVNNGKCRNIEYQQDQERALGRAVQLSERHSGWWVHVLRENDRGLVAAYMNGRQYR